MNYHFVYHLVITERTSCIEYFNSFHLASLRLKHPWMISDQLRRYVDMCRYNKVNDEKPTQPAITCSNLTIETLEQGVKYVQSNKKDTRYCTKKDTRFHPLF